MNPTAWTDTLPRVLRQLVGSLLTLSLRDARRHLRRAAARCGGWALVTVFWLLFVVSAGGGL